MSVRKTDYVALGIASALLLFSYFILPGLVGGTYSATEQTHSTPPNKERLQEQEVSHVNTPASVRAVYMSSWVAGTPTFRSRVVSLIEETELNAIIIDIKDDTGRISFIPQSSVLNAIGSPTRRIRDIESFIASLHKKGIYVIGRIAVFQDPYLAHKWPDEAVRDTTGAVWEDRKGISWLDPRSKRVHDYAIEIAKASYEIGFDEINFDYVRFPTDGKTEDMRFPYSDPTKKDEIIHDFFAYVHDQLHTHPMTTSVDLFGMTTTNTDDLNIGQILENTLPYFDYVAPMVYPSHYPPGWNGIAQPAEKPYEVIEYAMSKATQRAMNAGISPDTLRPWLQDFNLGATYTPDMVRDQIQATYDAGLDSWMLWDPANTYTREALHAADFEE